MVVKSLLIGLIFLNLVALVLGIANIAGLMSH